MTIAEWLSVAQHIIPITQRSAVSLFRTALNAIFQNTSGFLVVHSTELCILLWWSR